MAKSPAEITLMEMSTPEARIDFVFSTFRKSSISSMIERSIRKDADIGKAWSDKAIFLANAALDVFSIQRNSGVYEGSKDVFIGLIDITNISSLIKDKSIDQQAVSKLGEYVSLIPEFSLKAKKQKPEVVEFHGFVVEIIKQALDRIVKKLHSRDSQAGNTRAPRMGDIIAEGPGFEVVVGHRHNNVVRYSEGRTGIILMHDPRDGHFILVERYSDVDGGFILELPKTLASSMPNKESAAAIALRDLTGLSLRSLEKIGEISPDTHMIDGVCDVFYGTFDLEENYQSSSKYVRDVKRINEEGLYQAAYDGKITCAQTLSAISIWHAFESVRKKRVANSRRVRTPKGGAALEIEGTEGEDE